MSYIGNTPTTQGYSPAIDYFNGTGSQTAFTLSRPVASVAQVVVVVNNVTQNPSSAYTVSGNTITFTGAPSSGASNIYVSYTSPITQVQALTQSPTVIGPMYVSLSGGTPIGGATNPIMGLSGAANNYVQGYVNNTTNGVNSSADLVAYPSNGTDASGWVDMGITSPSYSQAAFSVTGPNESYLFGSAPSGSGTTGNLVYATDSTGTQNYHQFYNGGFNKAKNAMSATISTYGIGVGSAVATSGSGVAFPATQNASSDANTLDDYEEGTWTPAFDSDVAGTGRSTAVSYAKYTKVGRLVTVEFAATITVLGSGGSGAWVINGLPFPTANQGAFAISYSNALAASLYGLAGEGSGSRIVMRYQSAAGASVFGNNAPFSSYVTTNTSVSGTLTYMTT